MASVQRTSCYTSIKTRIETKPLLPDQPIGLHPLATLPSKQGLKPPDDQPLSFGVVPLATLPSKQGLKPDVPAGTWYWGVPLATLPSKQGLKLN